MTTVSVLLGFLSMIAVAVSDFEEEEDQFSVLGPPDGNPTLCYLDCTFPPSCSYGSDVTVNCSLSTACEKRHKEDSALKKHAVCQYCFQTPSYVHNCVPIRNCSVTASPWKRMVRTMCSVSRDTICMGRRVFYKKVPCNWTSGYKWSTAFTLSVTLGGFGADRFYLGLWQSGLGKLFSFGGLGIWTLIDVVLVGVGYIGPADGSLYMNF